MKLVIILTVIASLHVSAAGYGQTLTLSMKNASLESVFKEIKKQSHYDFLYNTELLKNAEVVSIYVREASVEQVLEICFKQQPFSYVLQDRTILIQRKAAAVSPDKMLPPKLITAHGTVFNEAGQPLSGANVALKQTGKGITTNAKGEFEFPAVPENSVLVVSYIGYAPQQVKVTEGSSLQVFLKVTKEELDKVVIQAYGTTTQRLATGNIATVTAAQIERHPVMNVLEALQGQVPGVVVQQTSGYASAPFKVEIRGRSAINPNLPSDPLYIIDGVPLTILEFSASNTNYASGSSGFIQNGFAGPAGGQSPFFSINPNDIESITVLKDADATAIYGSRGANGVIIMTTKRGKPGKTKFDLNVYTGLSKVTGHYDLLNLPQYLAVRREAFKNDGIVPDAGSAYDLLLWDTTSYTDFQKAAVGGIGKTVDVEGSLSGGDKLTTFRVAGGYHRETSALNYSGADQKASIQFNLLHKSLNQRFNVSFTNMFSYSKSDLISLSYSTLLPPDAPSKIFDSRGHLNYVAWQPVSYLFPYANVLQPYDAKTLFLNSQLGMHYEVFRGFTLSTNLGYSNQHMSQNQITPIASQDPITSPLGSSSFGNNNGSRSIVEPQIDYKTDLSKGKLSLLIGGSKQVVSQDANTIQGYGYINDALLHSVSNAPLKNANDGQGQYKYGAVFGRFNYNWDDKYIINLSARRDGSSRFGPGKQFGNFWSVGSAWIFTEESFFKEHLSFLTFGKVRGSYGVTGSDQIGDYQYLTQWSAASTIPYQTGIPAYIPLILANPNFQWQVNKKLEVALNIGFLKDRINIEGSFYRNRCDNQLIPFPLPAITGFNSVTANSPANVQNSGWEVTARAKLIDKKDFNFSIILNAGRNYNKLLSYPNLSQSPFASRFIVGQPLNITPLLHFTGVDPQTGSYAFEDKNKDGTIEDSYPPQGDYYYKEINIKLDGGLGIDVNYKTWQLNLFFTYRINPFVPSAIYNGNPGQISNQSTQVLNRWRNPGDIAKFARFTTLGNNGNYFFNESDGVYSNGSYIRLRNLSLAYDLPGNWTRKIGLRACKIYARGENLFVITRYDGIDPDVPNLGVLPPSKIFTTGIQFGF